MNKKWEINRVSTPGRIFEKIKTEMAQPVGIVLLGADCDFKNEVIKEFQDELSDVKIFHGAPSTHEMVELIHGYPVSLFVLGSAESTVHALRHECVKVMRRIGAKTVVGIYVKVEEPQPLPGRGFMGRSDLQLLRTAARKLIQNPPTADGLDYLIVVEEKEG